jgi:allantoinase
MHDLVVRGGTLVLPDGLRRADVGIADGVFAEIADELPGGREEIDATGQHVLPGGIDAHVHFNEPGRTHWEGWATGTAALAAGGMTACFEMPLNAHPPTIDGPAFDAKLAAARASASVDFGLWGGIVPGNADRLEELHERGVIGFKAFMSASGVDDFARADDATLYEAMAICARLGAIVAVHAENDALTSRRVAAGATRGGDVPGASRATRGGDVPGASRATRGGDVPGASGATRGGDVPGASGATWREYVASRPPIAEIEAIARALAFAEDTGCALHVVHVSTPRGIELVAEARARGVDATCETCPHYLFLRESDMASPVAKCAPPIREPEPLWERLDDVALVASDHSPSPPELKASDDYFFNWGGIAGAQTTIPLLLTRADPVTVARLTASGPAERFRIANKGAIAVGNDADLALVGASAPLRAEDLKYRHQLSPFIGRELPRITTLLRGAPPTSGKLLRP